MTSARPSADLNDVIGRVLRYGVVFSSAFVTVGLVLVALAPPPGMPVTLQGALAANFGRPALSPSALATGVAGGSPIGLLQVGLLILIATPVARVSASVILFLRDRDALYVGVTLLVLIMLVLALLVVGPLEA